MKLDIPTAPKSFTFRKTLNEESPKATVPCRWIDDSQYVDVTAEVETFDWSGEANDTAPAGKTGARTRKIDRKATKSARLEKVSMMMRYRLTSLEVRECGNGSLGKDVSEPALIAVRVSKIYMIMTA